MIKWLIPEIFIQCSTFKKIIKAILYWTQVHTESIKLLRICMAKLVQGPPLLSCLNTVPKLESQWCGKIIETVWVAFSFLFWSEARCCLRKDPRTLACLSDMRWKPYLSPHVPWSSEREADSDTPSYFEDYQLLSIFSIFSSLYGLKGKTVTRV